MTVNRVGARRLAYWPNEQTRAEAARLLFEEKMTLAKVLDRYPDGVISKYKNEPTRGAARRAIWAHYALIQQHVGEPDIDPNDRAAVERVVREDGIEVARCRTGNSLNRYKEVIPDLGKWPGLSWYARQAPPSWPR